MSITLVNLEAEERRHENIHPTAGDATDLVDHADNTSTSRSATRSSSTFHVREPVRDGARDAARGAGAYWVQTPNFWFPIEPHFLVPAWHWLPEDTRVAILQRRGVGWAGAAPIPTTPAAIVEEHRLMRRRELARLFPDARIVGERFGGVVKSWTADRRHVRRPRRT